MIFFPFFPVGSSVFFLFICNIVIFLERNALLITVIANQFSYSVVLWIFILLMIYFDKQNFSILMLFNLSIFYLLTNTSVSSLRNLCQPQNNEDILSHYLTEALVFTRITSLPRMNFWINIDTGGRSIFFYIDRPFIKHHLFKQNIFLHCSSAILVINWKSICGWVFF